MTKSAIEKAAAVVTIRDANKMSAKGRKALAAWLRMHADMLLEHGKEYAPRFRGRYLYR